MPHPPQHGSPGRRRRRYALWTLWLVLAATPLVAAVDYYTLPLHDRPYSPDHALFKPSGTVGHGLGILGSLMMLVGVTSYSLRKRSKTLARFGKLSSWLAFHIFLCTLGPFFVLLHTSFRFSGIVSISFWSMALVVASGVFGRYVYTLIPKTVQGRFLEAKQIQKQQQELGDELLAEPAYAPAIESLQPLLAPASIQPEQVSLPAALLYSAGIRRRERAHRQHVLSVLEQYSLPPEIARRLASSISQHRALELRLQILRPFQRLFGYWHVFHLPLAILMFTILIIHIAVAVAFGYGWIF